MKSVSLETLIKSIKLSIVKSTEILEKSHIQKLSEYFNADGTPICKTLNLNGKETNIPLYTLVNHQTMALDELEMSFKAKLFDSTDNNDSSDKYDLVNKTKKNPFNPSARPCQMVSPYIAPKINPKIIPGKVNQL